MSEFLTKIKTKSDAIFAWIRQHPSIILWLIVAGAGAYLQCVIVGLCISPYTTEIYSMAAIREVLTTSAEVVAGLYGLTLTGYIFFLDRLQQQAEDDEMLEDIIALLKKRYHIMVLILSIVCFVVILLSFSFIIYNPESQMLPNSVYSFWGYETLLLVFATLLFNIYFVITVVDPDKIPRASLLYKQRLSNSCTELGNLQEFLQDYEEIEELLKKKTEAFAISQLGSNPLAAFKQLRGKELMTVRKYLSDPLMKKMMKLSQYYNYMVFSQEMTVTLEMCSLAKEVRMTLTNLEIRPISTE